MGILSFCRQSLSQCRHLLQAPTRVPGLRTSVGVTGIVVAASSFGWLQGFELSTLDQFFRLRPARPAHPNIVILEVRESDINHLQQWPLTDEKLTEILEKVRNHQPRVVGLDIYRDIPVPPGEEAWAQLIQSMPNLIGVEKAAGEPVAPSPLLAEKGQVALADLVLDLDNKVRRGVISFGSTPETYKVGLGAQLALYYLAEAGIFPEPTQADPSVVQLGATQIRRLQSRSGPYRGIDARGYQIMLDYQGTQTNFQQFSMAELLRDQIPAGALTDKIVLIGTTAPSLNDAFLTPYNTSFTRRSPSLPGVYIHATITRQLLEAAETQRSPLQDFPEPVEWLWIGFWVVLGGQATGALLQSRSLFLSPILSISILGMGLSISLAALGYVSFLLGWWIPVVAPALGLVASSIMRLANQNQFLNQLASLDQLTQVANRRLFDQTLQDHLLRQNALGLILCDVDYFKTFNDTYGHPAGDACLKQVAQAIQRAVRGGDLVARYGGEEFAVVLPNTPPDQAQTIAEQIRLQVMQLQIEHRQSDVHEHVTLSCGVTAIEGHLPMPLAQEVVERADKALYQAKQKGRNNVVLRVVKPMDP